MSGPIEAVHGDVGGLIVGGTMVCTSARTYFVRGGSRLWIAQLAAGRPVTVYGLPILAGKTPVGLAARVVAVRWARRALPARNPGRPQVTRPLY